NFPILMKNLYFFAGISEFPVYQYSEKLEVARELLSKRYATVLNQTKTTDTILTNASVKATKLTADEKTAITKNLTEVVKSSTAIHNELQRDYAVELERLHLEGKTLRVLQNMEIASMIDEVYFVMHFLTEFETLFKQIDDTDH